MFDMKKELLNVQNVSMKFNLNKEKSMDFQQYVNKLLKRQLKKDYFFVIFLI